MNIRFLYLLAFENPVFLGTDEVKEYLRELVQFTQWLKASISFGLCFVSAKDHYSMGETMKKREVLPGRSVGATR